MKQPNVVMKKPRTPKPEKPRTEKVKQPMNEKPEQATVETVNKTNKFKFPKWLRIWIKESQFLATTLSIILTFGTANVVDHCQRIKDRKLSALMVMSNIEQFSQELDSLSKKVAYLDSTATWMLNLPADKLDLIPVPDIIGPLNEIVALDLLSHDKTTENIFSSNIETWKNMGYEGVQFIDNVGLCFAEMNDIEKYWNDWVSEYGSVINDVTSQIQPGEHTLTKLLTDNAFRQKLESFHVRQNWLNYAAARCRYLNDKNMALFKIGKQEIMGFTKIRGREVDFGEKEPTVSDFRTEQLMADSLTTLRPMTQHIDSIMKGLIKPE